MNLNLYNIFSSFIHMILLIFSQKRLPQCVISISNDKKKKLLLIECQLYLRHFEESLCQDIKQVISPLSWDLSSRLGKIDIKLTNMKLRPFWIMVSGILGIKAERHLKQLTRRIFQIIVITCL